MHPRAYSVIVLLSAAIFAAPSAQAITAGFDTNFPSSITVPNGTSQIAFSNLPVTNATGASVSYSNSSTPTNVTGFAFNPNPGFVLPVVGDGAGTNDLILYVTPGTVTNNVTNTLIITVTNAPGANGTSTSLDVIVTPPIPGPPHLEVRFYNSSTNPADQVFILPATTDSIGPAFGNGFWWVTNGTTNTWTNSMATSSNQTVRLSDIGVSGTNAQGQPYYAIYTTNFPNAAWYLSYGGGPLPTNTSDPAPQTNSVWYGYEWQPFEVTLAGNPADKCDTTYINQFSIPMTVRALTNTASNAISGVFPSNSLAYYQICGFTNTTTVTTTLSNLASQFLVFVPNAGITNTNTGKIVMYAGPSAAGMGSIKGPTGTIAYPTLSSYFDAVKANTNRTTKIKDKLGLSGATNAGLGTNPVFMFSYEFDVVVTSNKALLLTNGTISISNQPGSTGTNLAVSNYTGLWMQIGADAGPADSWASSAAYLAPTPANYVIGYNPTNQTNTTMQTYTANASNGLAGTPVFQSSTNLWLQIGTNTGTIRGTNGAALTNPTAFDLYSQQFGTAIMGRILGDMAAGFALGFINSDSINPSYITNGTNAAYGDSPSGAWWGGNEYPQAGLSNALAYGSVNTNYSVWGNIVYSGTRVTYGHPIYDRMQYYGGGNPTSPFQIQPASATNNDPPVWVVEVEFFNGLSSVGGPQPSILTYSNWLTNYPSLTGTNTNQAADPDNDSFNNATEYAFDGNPTVGSPAMLTAAGSGTNSVFRFAGLQGASTNYTVQTTTNLSSGPWTNVGVTVTNAADQSGLLIPASYERREFTVPAAGSNSFYRVLFTNTP